MGARHVTWNSKRDRGRHQRRLTMPPFDTDGRVAQRAPFTRIQTEQVHTAMSTECTRPSIGAAAPSECAECCDFNMATNGFSKLDDIKSQPVTIAEAGELDSLLEQLFKTEHLDDLLSSSAWPPIEDSIIDDWPEWSHMPSASEMDATLVIPKVETVENTTPVVVQSAAMLRQTHDDQMLRAIRNNPLLAQVIQAVRDCKRQGLELGSPSSSPRAKRLCAIEGVCTATEDRPRDEASLSQYLQHYIACLKRMQNREENMLKLHDEW